MYRTTEATLSPKTSYLTTPFLQALPKVDLHRHLEGSLRLETLLEIAQKYRLDVPATKEALRPYVQVVGGDYGRVNFLGKFDVLRRFYCEPEVIYRCAYEAVVDAARDNVRYLELRFSPQALASARGFALDDIVRWVSAAAQQASEAWPIQVGLIISLLRHEDIDVAYRVAEVAFRHFTDGKSQVVGLDLAGDEVDYPAPHFEKIFREAGRLGMGITIHAGEWTGATAVRVAIEKFGATRIGHGIGVSEDPAVLKVVRERAVTLEVCLLSNLQTKAVASLRHHPLSDLFHYDVRVTVNTDDPGVSNSTLAAEYALAVDQLGLDYRALRQMILFGTEAAFLPAAERALLTRAFATFLPEPGANAP